MMRSRRLDVAVLTVAFLLLIGKSTRADGLEGYALVAGNIPLPEGRKTIYRHAKPAGGASVFVIDGVLWPGGLGSVELRALLDGIQRGNSVKIDWSGCLYARHHSFRIIGSLPETLSSAAHFEIESVTTKRAWISDANISFLPVLENSVEQKASDEIGPIATNPGMLIEGRDALDTVSVLTAGLRPAKFGAVLAVAGVQVAREAREYGDAMIAFKINGEELPVDKSNYGVNDLCLCSEIAAPIPVHAALGVVEGHETIEIAAGGQPWPPAFGRNPVRFSVRSDAKLLFRASRIGGAAKIFEASENKSRRRFPFKCIASDAGWRGCAAMDTNVTFAATQIVVPPGHSGNIFVSAITRIQADHDDRGGEVEMWIEIDGVRVGNVSRQGLAGGSAVSTRTMSASYYASGANSLSAGTHVAALVFRARGSFKHLSASRDLPLLWFD